jgi:hypothetical protein
MTTTLTAPAQTSTVGTRPSLVAGALLISAALLAAVGATWLALAFGWPEVLDAPGADALPSFAADATAIRTAFYLLLTSSLLLIPAAIYLEQVVGGPTRPSIRAVTAFGVLGGFAQTLGWVRWPVTVPHLSEAYSAGDEQSRVAVASAYDVLNRYAGAALGEHLGWLFQGLWAVGIAVLLLRVSSIPRWFSLLGLGLSLVWFPLTWASGLASVDWPASIGSTVSGVWYLWLLALGVLVAVRRIGDPAVA